MPWSPCSFSTVLWDHDLINQRLSVISSEFKEHARCLHFALWINSFLEAIAMRTTMLIFVSIMFASCQGDVHKIENKIKYLEKKLDLIYRLFIVEKSVAWWRAITIPSQASNSENWTWNKHWSWYHHRTIYLIQHEEDPTTLQSYEHGCTTSNFSLGSIRKTCQV